MKTFFALLCLLACAPAVHASFHLMQIEQVIGGVDGDPAAQAIQLRMRSSGQNLVSAARVRAWDAAGANPVLILDMGTNVSTSTSGSRVLLATSAFTTAVQAISPGFTPDFTMANAIPAGYLAAGKLTFEQDDGTILWSLAWGGASYTGTNTGSTTNDANGDFGAAFGQALPTAGRQGVRFTGSASALSTTNVADYALSADPATVVKNSGTSFITGGNPEIAVEQPANTDLTAGSSVINMGTLPVGITTAPKEFKIKNLGGAPLSISSIVMFVGDTGDFTINTSGTNMTIAGGGDTTFSVTFTPSGATTKNATLIITSDDANEGTFDINLTGTGTGPAGSLALSAASYVVNEGDGFIDIPLLRTGGTGGTVGVTVTTTAGTATLNADFTAPTTPQTLANGDTSANIHIPIVLTAASEPNETFTITISNPTGSASLGAITTATVRIIDSVDAGPPSAPVMNTPIANAVVNAGVLLNVSGTAKDDKGVDRVEVRLNNVLVGDAVLVGRGTPNATWSLGITPVAGPNVISVRSFDTLLAGSQTITSRSILAKTLLVVTVDSNDGSVTTGYAPNSYREVGKPLLITATPKAGHLFSRWVVNGTPNNGAAIGLSNEVLDNPTLNFVCRVGITLEAQFDHNHYEEEENKGTFAGPVEASPLLPDRAPLGPGVEDGTVPDISTEGLFSATVKPTGSFTGSLTIDGLVLPVIGTFDALGDARFGTSRSRLLSVARTGKPSLLVALHLDVTGHTRTMTGTVSQFGATEISHVSIITAQQAFYSFATHVLDTDYLTIAGTKKNPGVFNAHFEPLPPASQPAGFTTADYPQGDGTGVFKVSSTGAVSLTGTLADGTSISASTTLSQTLTLRLFAQLYSKRGFFAANVTFNKAAATTDLTASNVQWSRPIQDVQHYPRGWQGVKVQLLGAKYTAVAGSSVLTGLTAAHNADLVFSSGGLTGTVNKVVSVSPADAVTEAPISLDYSLAITRSSGAFNGSFTHNFNNASLKYQGIVLQKGAARGAFGYWLTLTPKVKDYTGKSGRVLLTPQ